MQTLTHPSPIALLKWQQERAQQPFRPAPLSLPTPQAKTSPTHTTAPNNHKTEKP